MAAFHRFIGSTLVASACLWIAAAHADQRTLEACQMRVKSTSDNAECFNFEIARLEHHLPPGPATNSWKTARDKRCEKVGNDEADGGTAGIGITQACRLSATRERLHLPT